MKGLLFFAALFLQATAGAQYYYKDIVGTAESNALVGVYKKAGVRTVVLQSYDADNTRSADFAVAQQFDAASGRLRTTTQSGMSAPAVLLSFSDAAGRVVKTVDSSETSVSTTEYRYGADGALLAVQSVSSDAKGGFRITEEHQWLYTGNQPTGMLRIRNGKDSTQVRFVTDAAGNIIEEHAVQKGIKAEPVYYYYNDRNQLTDIVRFNNKAKRLLPEYMFEYDDAGRVIQRITFPANSSEYTIWRYQYNAAGLRIREAVYNKQKELTGKIEYRYE